jgi:hypothetical protein
MESLNGVELVPGMVVWVDTPHMPGHFAGDVMKAEVVKGYREPQAGMIWVRTLPTPANPYPGEGGGWVSEHYLNRVWAF